jgi:hypothetical protein
MESAYAAALTKTARRMLGEDSSQLDVVRLMAAGRSVRATSGLRGLARYGEALPTWRERADGAAIAGYASRCIEKYGTGGGNFRTMFASFLGRARTLMPGRVAPEMIELAAKSSSHWTDLAAALERAASNGDAEAWGACAKLLGAILELETRLFESLGDRCA